MKKIAKKFHVSIDIDENEDLQLLVLNALLDEVQKEYVLYQIFEWESFRSIKNGIEGFDAYCIALVVEKDD